MFSEIYCIVKGKVQGVGYRYSIEQHATTRGLSGWVRNRNDGSVEVLIQGTPDDLKECIEVINQGSPLSAVESVAVDWRTPETQFTEFKVIAS